MKIIKLTEKRGDNDVFLYLNANEIFSFYLIGTTKETIINYADDMAYVIETPEQIIELIKGATEI